jgi:hypothetical protein
MTLHPEMMPDFAKSDLPKYPSQFPNRVFFQVEAGRGAVEKARDIAGAAKAVGRDAQINFARNERAMDVLQLFECVVRMQMLHQLSAVRDVDGTRRHGNIDAVREDQLKVGGDQSRAVIVSDTSTA